MRVPEIPVLANVRPTTRNGKPNTSKTSPASPWAAFPIRSRPAALRGEDGSIVDRTGAVLSEQSRGTTRLRKREDGMMEAVITIEDPVALTRPWTVTKTYRKLEGDVRIMDYACAENNRNPVDPATGKTLTLGADGKPIDADHRGD